MIYLARHAEAIGNIRKEYMGARADPLTETGQSQARELGRSLKDKDIRRLYSSDLLRAIQTSEIVLKILETSDLVCDSKLRERQSNYLQGKPFTEIKDILTPKLKTFFALTREERLNFRIVEDAETPIECWRRLDQALKMIHTTHPNENVLCITHNGLIGSWLLVEEQKDFIPPDMLGSANMLNTGYVKINVTNDSTEILQKVGFPA